MKNVQSNFKKFLAALLILTLCAASVFALAACDKTKEKTVTFVYAELGGGKRTTVEVKTDKNGIVEEPSSNPTKDGNTFLYWTLEGQSDPFDFDTKITQNITLVPKWGFSVTFELGENQVYKVDVVESGKAVKPADPSKEDHVFEYWTLKGSDAEYDFNTTLTANIVLTAKWKEATPATVTFKYDNGQPDRNVAVNIGGQVEEPSAPTKTNFKFAYWAVEGENAPFNFNTKIDGDIVLVAIWQKDEEASVTVTYKYDNGKPDVVRTVLNGQVVEPVAPTKTNCEFLYWALEGEDTAFDFGTKIQSSIVLIAKWKPIEGRPVAIHWNNGNDGSAKFVFDGAAPGSADLGTKISFKVKISPYFTGVPVVTAGVETVQSDANGVYSFVVSGEVTVSISGLSRDNTPMTGRGTEFDPYIISTASQLKTFTDGVNNNADEKFNTAYVKLAADIDLQGEIVDPIGTGANMYLNTMFRGTFDGNGHMVKNFNLSDDYQVAGLFGFINYAVIKNLAVEAQIDVFATDSAKFVGGIVGYNFASDVIGCVFNGSIEIVNDADVSSLSVMAGGIVGFMQGEGSTLDDAYTATVSYCSVDAEIMSSGSKEMTSIGGVVGAMVGLGSISVSNVYNCSANVRIEGLTRRAGGIVGFMRELASIDNCIATGTLRVNGETENPIVGGIVGETYNENTVAYCLSSVKGGASGASTSQWYGIAGLVRDNDYANVDQFSTLFINNVYASGNTVESGGATYDVSKLNDVLALMDWAATEWTSADGRICPDAMGIGTVKMNVTFKFGSAYNDHSEVTLDKMIEDMGNSQSLLYSYLPVSYIFEGDGFNTLTADNGDISYGYFLDEAHTRRVPASFMLTGHDVTIYVGFADYSKMQGEFYTLIGTTDVKLTFDDNGMMTMLGDGKRSYYMYVFNGERAVVHDAYFVYLGFNISTSDYNVYRDFYVEFTDNGLSIYDGEFFGGTLEQTRNKINAIRDNGILGDWYTQGQTTVYTFNADGTGSISNGYQFTYEIVNRSVTLKIGNRVVSARLSDDGLTMSTSDGSTLSITKYDEFNGVWESDYNDCTVLRIDGVNTAKIGNRSFVYSVEEGRLVSDGLSAYFNENGYLVVEYDGKTLVMGREGSFIGTWTEKFEIEYQFVLLGINKDGYGVGYDSYGIQFTYVYNPDGDGLNIYYRTSNYGFGNASSPSDKGSTILSMAMYTPGSGMLVDDYQMTFTDKFYGVWNSESGMKLDFNGNGAYFIHFTSPTTGTVWDVSGKLTVTDGGKVSVVAYTYDRDTATATFVYNEKTYTVAGNGSDIVVKTDGEETVFSRPDELSENDWQGAGFKRISFDGRGNSGVGTVTMTDANGAAHEYKYTISGENGAVVITNADGGTVYTLDIATMTLSDASGEEAGALGVYNDILGKVYTVFGTDGPFELDCTNMLDKDGVAQGTWNGVSVVLSQVTDNTLSVYVSDMSSLVCYLVYMDENTVIIARAGSSGTLEPYNVAYIPDELMGVYYNADKSVKLIIDGSSKNSYLLAAATFTDIDANGEAVSDEIRYTYRMEGDDDWGIYSYERVPDAEGDGTHFEYTLVYDISFQAVDGAIKFETEDGGKAIWLIEA